MLQLASAASQGSGGSGALLFLLPIALIAFMFFGQRKRQRAAQARQQGVQVGDEITTTSGLFGRVVSLDDTVVTLEVSPGVNLRYDRRAVASVVPTVGASEQASAEVHDGPDGPASPITDR